MSDRGIEDVWIPLVDEPIGSIVAYIRVGLLLGQLLVEHDIPEYDGSDTWIDALLTNPEHRAAVVREVRAVAEEIAADPAYADDEPLGPDDEARARFLEFARKQLESS